VIAAVKPALEDEKIKKIGHDIKATISRLRPPERGAARAFRSIRCWPAGCSIRAQRVSSSTNFAITS